MYRKIISGERFLYPFYSLLNLIFKVKLFLSLYIIMCEKRNLYDEEMLLLEVSGPVTHIALPDVLIS